jgi:hypothetical protein
MALSLVSEVMQAPQYMDKKKGRVVSDPAFVRPLTLTTVICHSLLLL